MKGGDAVQATKLAREAWFQLGPGGFDREPQTVQTRMLDNARTMPLLFGAPPPPAITCDMLKNFPQPTLVMRGEKTQLSNVLISEAISRCVPEAQLVVLQNVNHDGPSRDPAAFTGAIFEFLSRR
jgi:pimeloyl-ACP methyl ester carboxylesterase